MNFIATFFLMAIVLSVSELFLLVRVAAAITFRPTLGLCILTAMIGGAMVRYQGIQTLKKLQGQVQTGHLPATEILEGLVLLIIGVLLCVPGFITDAFGFLMLVPPVRRAAVKSFQKHFSGRIKMYGPGGQPFNPGGQPQSNPFEAEENEPPPSSDRPRIIDVDFEKKD